MADSAGPDRRVIQLDAGAPLPADLVVPDGARGLVVIVGDAGHDAVLGRAAGELQEASLSTLLLRLATPDEAPEPGPPAAGRLAEACRLVRREPGAEGLELGVMAFGRSSAAALRAAAEETAAVRAVVCVDADVDPADTWDGMAVPTLLLVLDDEVLPANAAVLRSLPSERELRVVHSSRRSIEERIEGALTDAVPWLVRHLRRG